MGPCDALNGQLFLILTDEKRVTVGSLSPVTKYFRFQLINPCPLQIPCTRHSGSLAPFPFPLSFFSFFDVEDWNGKDVMATLRHQSVSSLDWAALPPGGIFRTGPS
jgi:hypothetical protein